MTEARTFWSRFIVREGDVVQRDPSDPAATGSPRTKVMGWGDLVGREGGGIVVLVVLFGALALASEAFLTGNNMGNLSRQFTVYGIIAVGELLVILTRGIDLSVGSVVGLTGAISAELMVGGAPVPVAVLGGMGTGLLVGLVNGVLVAYAKLPAFIVTLGMLGAARGLVLVITNASTIQPLPDSFGAVANSNLLGLPSLFWVAVVLTVVIGLMLRRTVWGRYIYATGSNLESARLSGVPVRRVQMSVFALSGLLAGIAGVLLTSRLDAGIPTAGEGYELDAIAACVIGGASLFGAKGSAIGAAIGAMITSVLNNGGNLLGVNSFYLRIAIGVLIILAISFDQLQTRLVQRSKAPPG